MNPFEFLFFAALGLLVIVLLTAPAPQKSVGCEGFGSYDPHVEYVVGPSKDYVLTGGKSTDQKVANAYNYGILYDVCR